MSIFYCPPCDRYTLQPLCPICHLKTINRKPARFSPQDPYGDYRRKLIQQQKK